VIFASLHRGKEGFRQDNNAIPLAARNYHVSYEKYLHVQYFFCIFEENDSDEYKADLND